MGAPLVLETLAACRYGEFLRGADPGKRRLLRMEPFPGDALGPRGSRARSRAQFASATRKRNSQARFASTVRKRGSQARFASAVRKRGAQARCASIVTSMCGSRPRFGRATRIAICAAARPAGAIAGTVCKWFASSAQASRRWCGSHRRAWAGKHAPRSARCCSASSWRCATRRAESVSVAGRARTRIACLRSRRISCRTGEWSAVSYAACAAASSAASRT